jgi:hypothetical protein
MACDITQTYNNGTYYDFEGCSSSVTGDCDITLIDELENGDGLYSVTGTATDGSNIDEEIIIPAAERVNPSKVFKWVAKKLKDVLCPSCM